MGYWAYMLVNTLLIPVIMLIFGHRFLKKGAPKDINGFYGHKTEESLAKEQAKLAVSQSKSKQKQNKQKGKN